MIYAGRFAGRTAVITGGASGLGLEAAKRITAEGGKVCLWDLNADTLAGARKETGAAHVIALDVSDPKAVEAAAAQSRKVLGKIDILINSAGITGATHTVIGYPIDSWLKVMDVNVNGLFYCCRFIAPLMVENGYGRIVNISSVAGKEGNPNASSYSASKAAVLGFTKSLGKELATKGVIVNAVTPATFESPILEQRAAKPYRLYALQRFRWTGLAPRPKLPPRCAGWPARNAPSPPRARSIRRAAAPPTEIINTARSTSSSPAARGKVGGTPGPVPKPSDTFRTHC